MGVSIWARRTLPLLLLAGCAIVQTPGLSRIALLAPFEGRYREIGYDALYAARLALADSDRPHIDLLAVDDGGTPQSAVERAHALADDPLVKAVIVLGYDAAAPETQHALDNVPALIVGNWAAQPVNNSVFMLANPTITDDFTVPHDISVTDAAQEAARESTPLMGGEVFALNGFRQLSSSLEGVTLLWSGALPDDTFSERYRSSDPFAPAPNLFAPLTYDAMTIALAALHESRADVRDTIASIEHEGLNGPIRFESGYWADAPIHRYGYRDGELSEAP